MLLSLRPSGYFLISP